MHEFTRRVRLVPGAIRRKTEIDKGSRTQKAWRSCASLAEHRVGRHTLTLDYVVHCVGSEDSLGFVLRKRHRGLVRRSSDGAGNQVSVRARLNRKSKASKEPGSVPLAKNNRSLPYLVSGGDRPLLGGRLLARRPRIEMGTSCRQRSLGMDTDSGAGLDDQAADRDALQRKPLKPAHPEVQGASREPIAVKLLKPCRSVPGSRRSEGLNQVRR